MTVASSGRLILIALLTACLSCNSRNAAIEPIAAPTGPTPAVPGLMVSFDPPGVMGGTTARGTVTLAQPAPAGGTLVTLQSGHPAVSVPSAVAVAPGALSAGFPVTTASVAADAAGSVSASAPGASATGSLAVWAVLPTFLSAVSEPGGFIGQGGFRRFTPQTATFTGSCSQSEVSIFVRDGFDFWILQFGAPRGAPLRPGLYEGATRTAFRNATSPGIDGHVASRPTVNQPSRSFFSTRSAKWPSDQPSFFHPPYSVLSSAVRRASSTRVVAPMLARIC